MGNIYFTGSLTPDYDGEGCNCDHNTGGNSGNIDTNTLATKEELNAIRVDLEGLEGELNDLSSVAVRYKKTIVE